MEIKRKSYFKNAIQDPMWFEDWVSKLETLNQKKYERLPIETSLGKTHVWGLNTKNTNLIPLVVFPGMRTTPLFWDFDNGLNNLGDKFRVFLVETNGFPNLSDGNTPEIKSMDFGVWASEVLDKLNLEKAFIAGASFGALIAIKLSIVKPERVKAIFLLNAGCLQPFALTLKNLYYNLMPIFFPNRKNVSKFLDNAIFVKPHHQLSEKAEKLIIDYELFALTRFKDNTQTPYAMKEELNKITVDTYILEGDKDILFPYQNSIKNAKERISSLKDIVIFENVGHGIETYEKAIKYLAGKIPVNDYKSSSI